MVFSSLVFTFIFLPIVVVLYYLCKEKYRNYILLIASLAFYAYGEPQFVFVMLASIVANYYCAVWIDKAKITNSTKTARNILVLNIIFNIGTLFIFKYLDFSASLISRVFHIDIASFGIALPIGISFFTFQALSYVIDVYRGTVKVQKNPLFVALYISFFPQLVAGPIVRYSTIEEQIAHRNITADGFAEGVRRFFLGFGKKVILANNLSNIAVEVMSKSGTDTNPLLLWMGTICYGLQIFYDFSGYSDMAIGLGKMFGFEFEENFNYPYMASSATDFWRRWHMSLSRWFRDYVYIPLGGSRVKIPRQILNLFIVWLLTGIWHGAQLTYVVWGLVYFVLLLLERYVIKLEKRKSPIFKFAWRIITLLAINFAWVLFNSGGLGSAMRYCLGMIGFYHVSWAVDTDIIVYIREYWFYLACGFLFTTPIAKICGQKLDENEIIGKILSVVRPLAYGLIFIWAVSFLVLGAHNPFIYFTF